MSFQEKISLLEIITPTAFLMYHLLKLALKKFKSEPEEKTYTP